MNLFALLDQAATRFPDRGAVYQGERQFSTWRELRERALRLATSIRESDPAGARIALVSENRPEIVELMWRSTGFRGRFCAVQGGFRLWGKGVGVSPVK